MNSARAESGKPVNFMDQMPEANPVFVTVVGSAAMASAATWLVLLARLARSQPLLSFSPRRQVPWGSFGAMLAVLMVLFTVLSVISLPKASDPADLTLAEAIGTILVNTGLTFTLTAVFLILAVVIFGANASDLGLPSNGGELLRDVRIGIVGWLAALLPVYGLQAALVNLLGTDSEHPLIKIIMQDPNPSLLAVGFFSAVVVAPLCEESAFRLLLQGYLEKWEAQVCSSAPAEITRDMPEAPSEDAADKSTKSTTDAFATSPTAAEYVKGTGRDLSNPYVASAASDTPDVDAASQTPDAGHAIPWTGLLGLPHGWLPIGISSLLFATAHVGHGPDPIALFFLALILGYVYHRTHRILPCIIIHFLFNGLSLLALVFLILGPS